MGLSLAVIIRFLGGLIIQISFSYIVFFISHRSDKCKLNLVVQKASLRGEGEDYRKGEKGTVSE